MDTVSYLVNEENPHPKSKSQWTYLSYVSDSQFNQQSWRRAAWWLEVWPSHSRHGQRCFQSVRGEDPNSENINLHQGFSMTQGDHRREDGRESGGNWLVRLWNKQHPLRAGQCLCCLPPLLLFQCLREFWLTYMNSPDHFHISLCLCL